MLYLTNVTDTSVTIGCEGSPHTLVIPIAAYRHIAYNAADLVESAEELTASNGGYMPATPADMRPAVFMSSSAGRRRDPKFTELTLGRDATIVVPTADILAMPGNLDNDLLAARQPGARIAVGTGLRAAA